MAMWPLVLFCFLPCLRAFNLDVNHSIVFHRPKEYFGFAVGLLSNDQGNWALVTAPKANSTNVPSLVSPGVLYQCNLELVPRQCQEVLLDLSTDTRDVTNVREFSYRSLRDDGWLGVTLDVGTRHNHVAVCGHLWKNQIYSQHYFSNGVCYVTNKNLQYDRTNRLLPLIHQNFQMRNFTNYGKVSYFSQGQFGMSAAFSETGDELHFGAPGVFNAKGTVVEYRNKQDPRNIMNPVIPLPPLYKENFATDTYLGYAVTSGKFFKAGKTSIASGAPRDADERGRVYIYDELNPHASEIIPQITREGTQVGEYFGSSLLAIDLNKDGYSDLLVGSPLYSTGGAGDQGKVSIFLSSGMGLRLAGELLGEKIRGARFGTALGHLGDLNKDGYNDFAVSAPYEEVGGVVYIYHGSKEGVNTPYVQRIIGRSIDPLIKGFGMSISRGKDMDSNDYNDVVIGAHDSGHAIYLRARPVIRVRTRINFMPELIDTLQTTCTHPRTNRPATCFEAKFCLRYMGESVQPITNLETSFEVDVTRKGIERGFFNHQNAPTTTIRENLTYSLSVERCRAHKIYLEPDFVDKINPIVFRVNFSVPQTPGFCKTCPILDPSLPNSVTKEANFVVRCGTNRDCRADLELQAYYLHYRQGEVLILGENKTLTISASVRNIGKDMAYQSYVELTIPEGVGVVNLGRCRPHQNLFQQVQLLCTTGNPLSPWTQTDFQVKLDVSKLSGGETEQRVTVKLKAFTTTTDINLMNNEVELTAYFSSRANIKITGFPDREQILLEKDPEKEIIPITHTYQVRKYMPSPIRSVYVALSIPTMLYEYSVPFIYLTDVQVANGKGDTVAGTCNITNLGGGDNEGPDRGDITINVDDFDPRIAGFDDKFFEVREDQYQHLHLGCSNSKCTSVFCEVGPFEGKRTTATIQMGVKVNVSALQDAVGPRETISIYSQGYAKILDEMDGASGDIKRSDSTQVRTTFVRAGSPPVEDIVGWKLYLSILIGALLFIAILVGLMKCGFFKRQTPEDQEKKEQASLLQDEGQNGAAK